MFAVVDDSLSPTFPLGDALEVYLRREDAEGFIEEIRGDEPELAETLRIEARQLRAGELAWSCWSALLTTSLTTRVSDRARSRPRTAWLSNGRRWDRTTDPRVRARRLASGSQCGNTGEQGFS